jgi:hypothetical protein
MQFPIFEIRTTSSSSTALSVAVALAARALIPALLVLLSLLLLPGAARTQQFVVDDAALVDRNACQLEAWHGETETRFEPACQLVRGLELMAGVGLVGAGRGRQLEYRLEAKYLLREPGDRRLGVALLAGLEYQPGEQGAGLESVYAYVPVTVPVRGEQLLLHANLGWHYERDAHEHGGEVHDEPHHALTWGLRADLLLPVAGERFALIGELFGEDRLLPEFQVGLRSELIAERLTLDLSWGGHTQGGLRGAGWTLGLAWTPPPLR